MTSSVRVHDSFLARMEKKALIWLAHRMPGWVNSDHLTVLGLTAMMAAGLAYRLTWDDPRWLWAVNALIVVNWFGDSLDGTLARVRNKQRPRYGYYVDHVVDAVSAVFLFGGLGLSPYMTWPVAVALLIAYLLLSVESYLATHAMGEFHISHFGFGPTELRLVLIAGNLALIVRGMPSMKILGVRRELFDIGGAIGAACLFLVFAVTTAKHTAALYRQETK
jgi:phosphatidylglycerophosphate synthase